MALGDLKTKLQAKFARRKSTISSLSSAASVDGEAQPAPFSKKVSRSLKSRASQRPASTFGEPTIDEKDVLGVDGESPKSPIDDGREDAGGQLSQPSSDLRNFSPQSKQLQANSDENKHDSTSTTGFPTPNTDITAVPEEHEEEHELQNAENIEILFSSPTPSSANDTSRRPSELSRRQSLLPHQQTRLIKTLLETDLPPESSAANLDYFTHNGPSTISANMVSRKIWVKRPNASATLVTIHEDDLVDDVRDMILRKYANSLGRSFDAPDVTLRIVPRENRQERTLGPEEPMGRTLDAYFPGGQTVDEALVIDVPLRRTPKPSPQPNGRYYHDEDRRPAEAGSDYFPPMPVPSMPSPHLPGSLPVNGQAITHHPQLNHSMSVLTTGHVPNLPSPGSVRRPHHRERPRMGRQHTSSPTVIGGQTGPLAHNNGMQAYTLRHPRSRTHSSASEKSITNTAAPTAPPLPTPPAQNNEIQRVATPPPRVSSPRPQGRSKRNKKGTDHPSLPAGLLNGAVPPINVLIVEDNIINLKLLEAFMKRLKVRWQTAMNGREAVTKWRAGGFHLVLMDIQLPIMSGLEATKEIRRLERLNSIGVFSSSASSSAPSEKEGAEPEGEDKLPSTVLFKSPVIIVALTASSLQSDRHEALAAGCNDFLTKVRYSPSPPIIHPPDPNFLLTIPSPSTSSGSNAKSWNGAACKP
jgi:osomolarity two-component system response regulator SSK1